MVLNREKDKRLAEELKKMNLETFTTMGRDEITENDFFLYDGVFSRTFARFLGKRAKYLNKI